MENSEFYEWKNHSITQTVQEELKRRVEALFEALLNERDPARSAEMSGTIKAYRDIINISVEDL